MRFVLIRPPFVDLSYGPPIGLAHIQGALKEAGHECVVFDINLDLAQEFSWLGSYSRDFVISSDEPVYRYAWEAMDAYCDFVRRFEPDVVGFYLTYPTREYGVEMARRLSPHVRCIAGGPEASYNEGELLELLKTGRLRALEYASHERLPPERLDAWRAALVAPCNLFVVNT